FNDQYIKVVRSNVRNNRHFADNVIARTEDRLAALSQSKQSILLGALVLLALLVLGALFLWKGRGGRGARPKRPSEGEGGLLGPMDPSLGGHPGRSGDTAAQDRLMPEETEASILEQLKTFEQGTQYLQPNLSLAQLAVEFQVNTKYLSHTINNHKGNDFNNYINGLRIQYIIQKLRENPEYLNYKISYLSSECGFSSHSKFSSAFKHVTGHTPSAFSEKVRN